MNYAWQCFSLAWLFWSYFLSSIASKGNHIACMFNVTSRKLNWPGLVKVFRDSVITQHVFLNICVFICLRNWALSCRRAAHVLFVFLEPCLAWHLPLTYILWKLDVCVEEGSSSWKIPADLHISYLWFKSVFLPFRDEMNTLICYLVYILQKSRC